MFLVILLVQRLSVINISTILIYSFYKKGIPFCNLNYMCALSTFGFAHLGLAKHKQASLAPNNTTLVAVQNDSFWLLDLGKHICAAVG